MSGHHSFDHLLALSTSIGTFEHADHRTPRPEHGFCTDDMARVLVVASREPEPAPAVRRLGHLAGRFLADAQDAGGRVHNRRAVTGRWLDRAGVDDPWGRSLWGLGTAARRAVDRTERQVALVRFEQGVGLRSPWPRSMAFAALGAVEVLAAHPHHDQARALLLDAAATIGRPGPDPRWRWPQARLSYANAALAEALIAGGHRLGRDDVVEHGLTMLGWLLARETVGGHLSPTPVGGADLDDRPPAFDQQPIEVATMADACRTAADVSGDHSWLSGVEAAAAWFHGDNDAGAVMWDPATGGGYDGLHRHGPNLNQGAESTLAVISTLQQAARLTPAAP